jgi:hypothetical protein
MLSAGCMTKFKKTSLLFFKNGKILQIIKFQQMETYVVYWMYDKI